MKYKPLTKKEIKKGKDVVKIYNTDTLMPWEEVFTRIKMNLAYVDIDESYGNLRKIVLFAILEDVGYDKMMTTLFDDELKLREQKAEIIQKDGPVVIATMEEAVNEYAPNFAKKVATLLDAGVDRSIKLLNNEDSTSNDVKNVFSALQVATDIAGKTQRHSGAMGGGGLGVPMVTGFMFVEGQRPDPTDVDVIEAETDG